MSTGDQLPPPVEAGPSKPSLTSLPSSPSSRPPFRPHPTSPSPFQHLTEGWIQPFSHPVHFRLPHFFAALKDLSLHPERNSSLILRADPLPPRSSPELDEEAVEMGMERLEEVRIRLMPKQPKRDGKLDQRVTFYRRTASRDHGDDGLGKIGHTGRSAERGMVMMIPEVKNIEDVPFFHPPVRKLAFEYESIDGEENVHEKERIDEEHSNHPPIRGRLSIAYLPFPSVSSTGLEARMAEMLSLRPTRPPRKRSPLAPTLPDPSPTQNGQGKTNGTLSTHADQQSPQKTKREQSEKATEQRLLRTCLALLERVYKHAYGDMVGYKKRMAHDVVVPRETFQDLYLVLKDRHRHLDSRAAKPGSSKVEDVKRHVWKLSDASLPDDTSLPTDLTHWGSQDVAIAAFLMLLWRDMYPPRPLPHIEGSSREWDTWGRPLGGFVDLGCGNGLLLHILTEEGYQGYGYELRARRTWPLYPPTTRDALVEMPIDFPSWFPTTMEGWESGEWEGKDQCPIQEGCFVIGNHADEITPWIPLLSLIPSNPVPYLSLPCCFHNLDTPFTVLTFQPPSHPHTPSGGFEEGLEQGQSRYKTYLMWLGWCGLMCGWEWEKEGLRIPSTKGWGIVARKRWTMGMEDERTCREWVLEQVDAVRERGLFKVREKEGKDH